MKYIIVLIAFMTALVSIDPIIASDKLSDEEIREKREEALEKIKEQLALLEELSEEYSDKTEAAKEKIDETIESVEESFEDIADYSKELKDKSVVELKELRKILNLIYQSLVKSLEKHLMQA